MSIQANIRAIGPSTWMPTLAIRNRVYHCNGTMTYRRRIRAISNTWAKRMRATRRPWVSHWLDRPANPPPGSYEHARLSHLEMERIALRRPQL